MVNTNQGMAIFIMIFVGVIVSVAILTTVSDNISGQTQLQAIANESVDIASARLANEQINESVTFTISNNPGGSSRKNVSISGFVLKNSTGGTATDTTDYVINVSNGVFTIVNSTFWVFNGTSNQTNDTIVDYSFPTAEYISDTSSRSIISLILIFAIIAIFIFVVVMIFKSDSMKNILEKI